MKYIILFSLIFALGIIAVSQSAFADEYISPKKQLDSGVPIDQIQCRDGKIFVLTVSERPMCLTSETASKIMKKVDWTIMKTAVPAPTENMSLKEPPLERGPPATPMRYMEKWNISLDELPNIGEDETITTTYAKSTTLLNIQDGLPQGFEVKAVYHKTPGNLMTDTHYIILPTDVEFSTDMVSSDIYRHGGMHMWYSSGTTNGMTISIDDFNQDRPYLTYKKGTDYDILIHDDYTTSVRISAVAANGMDYIKIIANDSTANDLENIVKYVWGINTNVQYIKHEQVIDNQPITPVLLYSSKLNDNSNENSSTPLPPAPFDLEVTLSKMPNLGESTTISMKFDLKEGFEQFVLENDSISATFFLTEGFDFPEIDKTSSTFTENVKYVTNTITQQKSSDTSTIIQTEIMPIQVGNWKVSVDGGYYNTYQAFYFIVTEDGTTLGEKPLKHRSNIIPEWIKANFGWWETGQIKDMTLDNSVQALIHFGILDVNTENIPQEVSPQFRQDIRDWHDGLMSDADFLVILKDWVEN